MGHEIPNLEVACSNPAGHAIKINISNILLPTYLNLFDVNFDL